VQCVFLGRRWVALKRACFCGQMVLKKKPLFTSNIHKLSYRKGASFLQCHAMHKRGYCRHMVSVCPSVRLSVTFVSCAKTNKDIFEIFSPSGSQAILVFPYQTGWRYSDGNPPNGGVECKGYEKMTIFDQYLALSQKRL